MSKETNLNSSKDLLFFDRERLPSIGYYDIMRCRLWWTCSIDPVQRMSFSEDISPRKTVGCHDDDQVSFNDRER